MKTKTCPICGVEFLTDKAKKYDTEKCAKIATTEAARRYRIRKLHPETIPTNPANERRDAIRLFVQKINRNATSNRRLALRVDIAAFIFDEECIIKKPHTSDLVKFHGLKKSTISEHIANMREIIDKCSVGGVQNKSPVSRIAVRVQRNYTPSRLKATALECMPNAKDIESDERAMMKAGTILGQIADLYSATRFGNTPPGRAFINLFSLTSRRSLQEDADEIGCSKQAIGFHTSQLRSALGLPPRFKPVEPLSASEVKLFQLINAPSKLATI